MATTTNFGWETPDDTDLVKDGALAMRTLGNAIDTSLVDLKGGTTGQILSKTSNTDMDFTWVTQAAGGKVLQVVAGTTTTSASTTSTTYADSGLTASITPSLSSSKVLVLLTQFCGKTGDASTNLRLFRGATQLTEVLYVGDTGSTLSQNLGYSLAYLDSPSSTSSLTYKTQYASGGGGGTAFVQRNSNLSSIVLLEIGA
jgi:hypothetical protein